MDKIDIRDLIVRELKNNSFATTDQTGNNLRVVEDCDFVGVAESVVENLPIYAVKHRFSTPEKMAEWLHNNYEEIALNNGWKTQDDCQVPFCDLPTENRMTMIKLCIRYLNGA